jgi:hypothetical protein
MRVKLASLHDRSVANRLDGAPGAVYADLVQAWRRLGR